MKADIFENKKNSIIVTSGSKYIDIDAYAGIIAYANLLRLKGMPAKAVRTAKLNESITQTLLNLGITLDKYKKAKNDEFIIIDVSNKDYFDKIVNEEKIVEVIDHHTGFEEYWKNKLGKNAKIEFIGSVATLIVEEYEKENLLSRMSKEIAILLMSAILDNTLNFKAKVTNERDKKAYKNLEKLVGNITKYNEKYFLECQQNIEKNLRASIENDTKTEKICDILPFCFGQLTLWNKNYILSNKDIVYETLNNMSNEWMLNVISLEDGKSYIIANNTTVKKNLEELFNKSFTDDVLELEQVWLRKEIIKKARDILKNEGLI